MPRCCRFSKTLLNIFTLCFFTTLPTSEIYATGVTSVLKKWSKQIQMILEHYKCHDAILKWERGFKLRIFHPGMGPHLTVQKVAFMSWCVLLINLLNGIGLIYVMSIVIFLFFAIIFPIHLYNSKIRGQQPSCLHVHEFCLHYCSPSRLVNPRLIDRSDRVSWNEPGTSLLPLPVRRVYISWDLAFFVNLLKESKSCKTLFSGDFKLQLQPRNRDFYICTFPPRRVPYSSLACI